MTQPPPTHPRHSTLHPAAGFASASEGAATADPALVASAPLATLLGTHFISDGEIILLLLKPSLWFILLSSLPFAAIVSILAIAAILYEDHIHFVIPAQTAVFLIAARLMWATLQWMGRYYILTDRRILRLSGVFKVDVFSCPLRRVARTRLLQMLPERLLNIGHIEIIPQDEQLPIAIWQCISRPRRVHEQVIAAIRRAKHSNRSNGD
jgi:hypothetical protein